MSFELISSANAQEVPKLRTYTITGPDGKDYSIDGPEGATREQVISKIKERLGSSAPSSQQQPDIYTQQAQKQSIGENLLAGIGGGMTGLYLGAKQMLGKATPEEIAQNPSSRSAKLRVARFLG